MKMNDYIYMKTDINYNFQSGILTKHNNPQHTNYPWSVQISRAVKVGVRLTAETCEIT
jgi:hypothetical protein